ncbi:MAG: protein kinase [archaeon]|nr:protein kinase [archaeon]
MSTKRKYSDNYDILEKFVFKQTIGKGTFGKVKLAFDKSTGEKYAIKILEKSKIVTTDDLERVNREVTILRKVSHMNVIKIFHIGENDDNIYIVMEFCDEGELFNYIVEKQRLSEQEAAYFYFQLINGLEYIHTQKVVHRDLKPENLLLSKGKILKIIDFGLSNFYKGKLLKTPCGSPCYASPEMVSGHKYNGFYIDVWSTGIILFAMTCGYLPFEDPCNEILFKKILECKLNYPSFVGTLAKDLMKKILVTDPEKRIKLEEIKNHKFYLLGKTIFEKKHPEIYWKMKPTEEKENNERQREERSYTVNSLPETEYRDKENFEKEYENKEEQSETENKNNTEKIRKESEDVYEGEDKQSNSDINSMNATKTSVKFSKANKKNLDNLKIDTGSGNINPRYYYNQFSNPNQTSIPGHKAAVSNNTRQQNETVNAIYSNRPNPKKKKYESLFQSIMNNPKKDNKDYNSYKKSITKSNNITSEKRVHTQYESNNRPHHYTTENNLKYNIDYLKTNTGYSSNLNQNTLEINTNINPTGRRPHSSVHTNIDYSKRNTNKNMSSFRTNPNSGMNTIRSDRATINYNHIGMPANKMRDISYRKINGNDTPYSGLSINTFHTHNESDLFKNMNTISNQNSIRHTIANSNRNTIGVPKKKPNLDYPLYKRAAPSGSKPIDKNMVFQTLNSNNFDSKMKYLRNKEMPKQIFDSHLVTEDKPTKVTGLEIQTTEPVTHSSQNNTIYNSNGNYKKGVSNIQNKPRGSSNSNNIIINNTFNFKINKSINIYDNQKNTSNYSSGISTNRNIPSARAFSSYTNRKNNYSLVDKVKKGNSATQTINYVNFLENKNKVNKPIDLNQRTDYFSERKNLNTFNNFERTRTSKGNANTNVTTPNKNINQRGMSHFNNRKITLDDYLFMNDFTPSNKANQFSTKINYTSGNVYEHGKNNKFFGKNETERDSNLRTSLNFYH